MLEKEIDPDKIYYGVADKYLFNKRYPNFINGTIEGNRYSRIIHTIMSDKNELLNYVRSIDKQQAKAIKKLGDKSDFNERYIISFTEINDKTIKIIEKENHTNDYLLLI
jgi:hypothetical protein